MSVSWFLATRLRVFGICEHIPGNSLQVFSQNSHVGTKSIFTSSVFSMIKPKEMKKAPQILSVHQVKNHVIQTHRIDFFESSLFGKQSDLFIR